MRLIKFFSGVDEDFVRQHFMDAHEAEKIIAKHRKRAFVTVGVAASFVFAMLAALGFAIIKMNKSKAERDSMVSMKVQLDRCAAAIQKQVADAATAQAVAEEANKNVLKLLEECSRKRKK